MLCRLQHRPSSLLLEGWGGGERRERAALPAGIPCFSKAIISNIPPTHPNPRPLKCFSDISAFCNEVKLFPEPFTLRFLFFFFSPRFKKAFFMHTHTHTHTQHTHTHTHTHTHIQVKRIKTSSYRIFVSEGVAVTGCSTGPNGPTATTFECLSAQLSDTTSTFASNYTRATFSATFPKKLITCTSFLFTDFLYIFFFLFL